MQSRHVVTVLASPSWWRLRDFYMRVFSWVPVKETDDYVELEMAGGGRVAICGFDTFGRNAGSPPADARPDAIKPVEMRLEVRDLAIAEERLLESGARKLPAALPRSDADAAAYFTDPDGNVISLVARTDLAAPKGHYTRDEFVRRVADVIRRSGVADAETLVRDLENSVAFPMLSRCGVESSLYGTRCVLLPGHEGSCQGSRGERWTRMASSSE